MRSVAPHGWCWERKGFRCLLGTELSLPARPSCHLSQVTLPHQLILLLAKRLRWVSMATAAGLPPGSAGSSGSALGTDTHSTNTSPAGALLQLVPPIKHP